MEAILMILMSDLSLKLRRKHIICHHHIPHPFRHKQQQECHKLQKGHPIHHNSHYQTI